MANTRRVEWIGVKSPLQDDRVTFRKIRGLYTNDEEVLLEAVATVCSPLIRVHAHRARSKGKRDGYSKKYTWGPYRFILDMAESDADRLFRHDPDEAEFRDLDNPDHDKRTPQVPQRLIDAAMYRIMQEAHHGPGVVSMSRKAAPNDAVMEQQLVSWRDEQAEKAKERARAMQPKGRGWGGS